MIERWADIPTYEGLYQVSSMGRVKSLLRYAKVTNGIRTVPERIKRTFLRKDYPSVQLSKNGVNQHFSVHILVARAFVPNPFGLPEVHHKDDTKTHSWASNLTWVTSATNTQLAHDAGLAVSAKGEDHVNAKLTEEQVAEMRQNPRGRTQRQLARQFSVNQSTISRIVQGQRWQHIPSEASE